MHEDFFLIAATPVVKVFLMLVARRKDNWETPSSPAMEPDRTVAPPARLMNSELMIFLQETEKLIRIHSEALSATAPKRRRFPFDAYFWESCRRLAALLEAGFCLA